MKHMVFVIGTNMSMFQSVHSRLDHLSPFNLFRPTKEYGEDLLKLLPTNKEENILDGIDDESRKFLGKTVSRLSKLAANEEPSLGTRSSKYVPKRAPATVVDDRFFKLSEMEEFLEKEEREKPERSDTDEEDIDYFEEVDEDDGNLMFKDFFDNPEESLELDEEDEDEEDEDEEMDTRDVDDFPSSKDGDVLSKLMDASDSEEESGMKSRFERDQEMESAKMRKLEKQNLESKPWQLQGEASGTVRPENSLLEEYLHFDYVSRDPPVVTVETSQKLEQMLKTRICNASWDDVERRIRPEKEVFAFRRRIELEQSKSKLSLAQVYEKEFNDKRRADEPFLQGKTPGQVLERTPGQVLERTPGQVLERTPGQVLEKTPGQVEVEQMSRSLLFKLSALSSFHFTPRLPEASVQMINNLPAITVEEAIPEATSTVTLVAPQEICAPQKRVTKGISEREGTDKKRERRFKKKFQANKFKMQGSKVAEKKSTDQVSGQSSVKSSRSFSSVKNSTSFSAVKSSTSFSSVKSSRFFSELQKKVTSANAVKLGPKKPLVNIKQLKL